MTPLALSAFFGAAAVGFAVVVAASREIFRAVFGLFGALGCVAVLIGLLGAPTIAALEILIYVGGVFVLFLFGILVTDRPDARLLRRGRGAIAVATILALVVGAIFAHAAIGLAGPLSGGDFGAANRIGAAFVSAELLTFEVVSILLLVGMVGAVVLIRKELE